MQFPSKSKISAVASIGSSLVVGDEVFAAGFPATEESYQVKGFAFTQKSPKTPDFSVLNKAD